MADKTPVVQTFLTISLGIIAVIAAIAIVTLIDSLAGLGNPAYALNAGGAAIGVAVWFAWLFRKKE